jgi:hypothetical protein
MESLLAVTQPQNLNETYLLATQQLKTTGVNVAGLATIFATKLDIPDLMTLKIEKEKLKAEKTKPIPPDSKKGTEPTKA